MKNKWFIIAVLFPLLSFSQGSPLKSSFKTIASLGIVAGESTAKPLIQVVSGFAFKKWFTGIGVGLDFYNLKSIPLFADVRMNFGSKGAGFLYADGGYNFSFDNKSNADSFYKTSDRFLGGLYMDAGIGYRVRLGSLHRLSFSAGYSQKTIVNRLGYNYPCITGGSCPQDVFKNHYTMGRIVTKLSWQFGK